MSIVEPYEQDGRIYRRGPLGLWNKPRVVTELTNPVPDEVTFTTPKIQSRITQIRYIEVSFNGVTETFRATRFYEQAAVQSAKERFIHRHNVKYTEHGRIKAEVVDYRPGTKFTIV